MFDPSYAFDHFQLEVTVAEPEFDEREYTDADLDEMAARAEWVDDEYPFYDDNPAVSEPEDYEPRLLDDGWFYSDWLGW